MPQITLEYTDNLRPRTEITGILLKIHNIIHKETGIALEHCKSRAIKQSTYCIGTGNDHQAFIHLEICLFAGRPLELKQKTGEQILRQLEAHFEPAGSEKTKLQITVEFRDMDKEGYFKMEV